jgi:hypothetical protein
MLERIPYDTLLSSNSPETTMDSERAFILAELVALRAAAVWRDDEPVATKAAEEIAEAIAIVAASWRKVT